MSTDKLYKSQYGASYAIVVGINNYLNVSPLSFASNDAEGVAGCLTDRFNFPVNNIHLLLDGAATKAGILKALMRFVDPDIVPDDRILFFFAGHGHTYPGRRETGFLIPQDGDPADLSTLIRWDELTRNADLVCAKHMLFLMDACYGGLAVNRRAAPAGSTRFLADLLQRYARQVLAAGKPDQPVSDGGGTRGGHSIFTSTLLDGLEGAAALGNGLVTGNSVMRYVYEKVGTNKYSQQTPHYGSFDGDGDFVFNPNVVSQSETAGDLREGDDVLLDVPTLPEIEPSETLTLGEIVKALIPNPADRIKLETKVNDVLRSTLGELGINNFPPRAQGNYEEEFPLRVRRYDELMAELETIAVLLAYWGESNQGQLLSKIVTRLAEAERPTAGLTALLNLTAYPVLAVMYAGGIGALAAGRYDMLKICLTTPVRRMGYHFQQATPILIPIVAEVTDTFNSFKLLPGLDRKYVPRSEHQLVALQPVVEDQLFLGRSYEELFDQFEIMLALVFADLKPSAVSGIWGPPGRFAYQERTALAAFRPFTTFVESVRAAGQAWRGFSAGFFGGSLVRFEEVAQGYANLIKSIGPVF